MSTLFWQRGDLTNTSIVLLSMAAVGAIPIAIGARC